jgi:hypothetical protein
MGMAQNWLLPFSWMVNNTKLDLAICVFFRLTIFLTQSHIPPWNSSKVWEIAPYKWRKSPHRNGFGTTIATDFQLQSNHGITRIFAQRMGKSTSAFLTLKPLYPWILREKRLVSMDVKWNYDTWIIFNHHKSTSMSHHQGFPVDFFNEVAGSRSRAGWTPKGRAINREHPVSSWANHAAPWLLGYAKRIFLSRTGDGTGAAIRRCHGPPTNINPANMGLKE